MRDDYTDITVILDRSGSMADIARDMCGGFDRMIEDQRKLPGMCLVSLRQFNTAPEVIYEGRYVSEVPPLEIAPFGGTALYDALAYTIEATGHRLSKIPEHQRPAKVLIIVITDGEENSSKEYGGPRGAERIKAMVKRQTEVYSWQFVYLGADPSAFSHAADLGIKVAAQYVASPRGAMAMNAVLSNAVGVYRSSRGSGPSGQSASFTMDSHIGEDPVPERVAVVTNGGPYVTSTGDKDEPTP
jgi:hypothetical protein